MDIGCLLDRTPVAQEPQDEQTDPTRLLRSLGRLCLGFVFTRDAVVPRRVAPVVVAPEHLKSVILYSTEPTENAQIARVVLR
jgi:hypothetical protein